MKPRLSVTVSLLLLLLAFTAGSSAPPPPGPEVNAQAVWPAHSSDPLIASLTTAAIVRPGAPQGLPAPATQPLLGESQLNQRFMVKFRDQVTRHRVMGVFLLPGEDLSLETLPAAVGPAPIYALEWSRGEMTQIALNRWQWKAPQDPGLYPVKILDHVGQDSTLFNMFVMVPFDRIQDGHLNRYRIGHYPTVPLNNNSVYDPPRGFVEITPENAGTLVTPHFKLEQFACKQEQGLPKYIVLQERLLLTLETILDELNKDNYRASTLHIMSGYRTPYYNQAIGNVPYSCHQWGVAADIFVDTDGDEMMDDLNQDGRIDEGDAGVLADIVEKIRARTVDSPPIAGGLAKYKATHAHGPFVHVDVRGFPARWGI